MAPATRTRVRLTRDERRDQLLDVAAALVATDGVAAVTMERVAERANASRGLGYLYFADRHELLAALVERESKRLETTVADATAAATGLEGKLRAAVSAYFDVLAAHGAVIGRLLQAPASVGEARARQQAGHAGFDEALTTLITQFLALPPARARAFVVVAHKALPATAVAVAMGEIERAEAEEVYVALVLGGLERLARDGAAARTTRKRITA